MENHHQRYEFIHFDTAYICHEFALYAKSQNIQVGHHCCSGNGCALYNIQKNEINEIKKEFLKTYKPRKSIIKIENTDICSVCLNNTNFVTFTCYTTTEGKYEHYLCEICSQNIVLCPLCRRIL